MPRRKYVAAPRISPASRAPVKAAEVRKALGGLPELVTFEAIAMSERFRNTFHTTPSHELIHVQQGQARIEYRRRSFVVGPKDTFVIPRGTEHRDVYETGAPYRTFYCFFHWDSGDDLVRAMEPRRLLGMSQASKELLHHLMTEFEREHLAWRGTPSERLSLILLEVLLALVRVSRSGGEAVLPPGSTQGWRDLAARARRQIEERYRENLGLEELARDLGSSPYHLSRSFSRQFGMSISEALAAVRMDRAREMLKAGGPSIKEVAAAAGFSDGNYFAKAFRRACGLSPSQYQALARRKAGRETGR
ncbi:MAG TPA: AraC family transcriptional regulator [Planctomycetota bacterium]|nr:AraC family transcriptional regulator [Planctomycetota bacterium]